MWPFRCGFFEQLLPRTWARLLREFFSHINPNRMASLMGIRAVDKAHRNAGKIKVVRSLASNQAEIFIRKFASFTFEIEELFRFFSLFRILSPNIIRWNRLLFNSTVNIFKRLLTYSSPLWKKPFRLRANLCFQPSFFPLRFRSLLPANGGWERWNLFPLTTANE